MTLALQPEVTGTIGLAEFVDYLERDLRLTDVDGLIAAAPAFRRLLNNRRFLGDFIEEELRHWRAGHTDHDYAGSTIVIARRPRFVLRANLWPALDPRKPPPRPSDPGFEYLYPHDHNFALLTGGYWGPGYETVHYEYDADAVEGVSGEPVELRELGRSSLPTGAIRLYYPSRDIHRQELPAELSISINVVISSPYSRRPQFLFDVPNGRISHVIAPASAHGTTLCDMAAHIGDDETAGLLDNVVRRVADPLVRAAAVRALRTMPLSGAGKARKIDVIVGDSHPERGLRKGARPVNDLAVIDSEARTVPRTRHRAGGEI